MKIRYVLPLSECFGRTSKHKALRRLNRGRSEPFRGKLHLPSFRGLNQGALTPLAGVGMEADTCRTIAMAQWFSLLHLLEEGYDRARPWHEPRSAGQMTSLAGASFMASLDAFSVQSDCTVQQFNDLPPGGSSEPVDQKQDNNHSLAFGLASWGWRSICVGSTVKDSSWNVKQ